MKAFVFDLDGVVCVGPRFTVSLERAHGIDQARWASFFAGPFLECIVGRRDLKAELQAHAPALGWSGSVDDLLTFWFETENVICPEALACVGALRSQGYPCYLGTNQERYRTEYLENEMGLSSQFDGIFSSSRLGHAKPAAAYFRAVEATIGSPAVCLIDDSIANVEAAAAFGWESLHYRDSRDLARILAITPSPRP
jgi:HAD superfamily hydrolase (TIGR01509 family)